MFDYPDWVTFPQHPVPVGSALASAESLGPLLQDGRLAPGHYVVSGPGDVPGRFLTSLCPALLCGASVLWLDAGNHFNAYGAGYATRWLGVDARAALARVQLARAFNLYQLETMVRVKVPARWRGEPVIISDPMPLFYDADVPAAAARRVLTKVLEGMALLPAAWLVLTCDRKAPAEREGWEEEFSRYAKGATRFYGPNFADDRPDAPGRRECLEALQKGPP